MFLTMEKVLEKEIIVDSWESEEVRYLFDGWKNEYIDCSNYMNQLSIRHYIDFSAILSFEDFHDKTLHLLHYMKDKGFEIQENPFAYPGEERSLEDLKNKFPEHLADEHTIYDICDFVLKGWLEGTLPEGFTSDLDSFVVTRDDVRMGDAINLISFCWLQRNLINMMVFQKNLTLRNSDELKLYELPF